MNSSQKPQHSWAKFVKFVAVFALIVSGVAVFRSSRPEAQVNKQIGCEIVEPSHDYLWKNASISEIAEWAKRGNASAQGLLATMYLKGEKGALPNASLALEWGKKAAAQGDGPGAMVLYHIYNASTGISPQWKNPEEALRWLQVAADRDVTRAQVVLGLKYLFGSDGLKNDKAKAFSLFSKAAAIGDYDATFYMGECYANSWGVSPSPQMAIKYLSLAADADENFFYKSEAQRKLAEAYKYGYGVTKDTQRAFEYFSKSAFLGDSTSQLSLAYAYETGEGVVQNTSAALVWLYVSRAGGGAASQETVNMFERSFDQNSLVKIREKAREIMLQIKANVVPSSTQNPAPIRPSGPKSSGTGVIISSSGLIVTAAHVVDGSSKVEVVLVEGPREASIVEIDSKNDLAILRVKGSDHPAAPLAASRDVKLGQPVFTIGFPNTDIQGASPKFTRGEISSVSGIRDEPTQWQISVPVQNGNSGSPLFDESGNVVGIVVSKLNAFETAKNTGDLIQNVNYAVKNAYLFPMLEKFSDKLEGPKKRRFFKKFESVVEDSKKSVVLILAY
jgi:TPR repeat protein